MKHKIKPLKGKVSIINKFNKDPRKSNFLNEFQEIMLQRLNLNHIQKYHKDNIKKIIRTTINKPENYFNTNIKNGFLLTCNVEPELYLKIQDTAKKITGDYLPMDELIHLLLTYFCHVYEKDLPKNQLPYKHTFKNKSFTNLLLFQKRFSKFYKNKVRSFTN